MSGEPTDRVLPWVGGHVCEPWAGVADSQRNRSRFSRDSDQQSQPKAITVLTGKRSRFSAVAAADHRRLHTSPYRSRRKKSSGWKTNNFVKPGQIIDIQLSDRDGRPLRLGNVLVAIQCLMEGAFRYGFNVGRTNDQGQLRVSYEDIETLRHKRAQEDLMDYNTEVEACDSVMRVVVPSERELRKQAANAMHYYQMTPD